MIITIDGPVCSGKSSVARSIANNLRIYYLNSGLLYRGLAYILVHKFNYSQKDLENPKQEDLSIILFNSRMNYSFDGKNAYIFFDDINITPELKNREVDLYSSISSVNKKVRESLLSFQRKLGQNYDLICEGRDCGSVVFPNADYKFFLTASVEIRAKRWQLDQQLKGKNYTLEECVDIISDRDKRDIERKISPLIVPQNAVIIDSSDIEENEVEKIILSKVKG